VHELSVVFEQASHPFPEYQVRVIVASTLVIVGEETVYAVAGQTHALVTLSNIEPGVYNISVAPKEVGWTKNTCVCKCTNLSQRDCFQLPGCPAWAKGTCLLSRSSHFHAVDQDCMGVFSPHASNEWKLIVMVSLLLAGVVVLGIIIVGIYAFWSKYRKPSEWKIVTVHQPKMLSLMYFSGGETPQRVVFHLKALLEKGCPNWQVHLDAFDASSSVQVLLNKGFTVLVLLSNSQDERQRSFLEELSESNYEGVDPWEDVVLVKLPYAPPPPPDLCTNRSVYTVPDKLADVCTQINQEDSSGIDEKEFVGDEHWALLQSAMAAHVQQRQQQQNERVSDTNQRFHDFISDYSSVI
jgi:hypothetical protein